MSNLVVVAIPAENDEIWNISSEQVPHLTLMFLGDAEANPNIDRISQTVQRLARDLQPFSLRVDHRGILGDDLADVLFFSNEIPYPLSRFRSRCMSDVNILSAYNSVPQHTEWAPHITLGYPTTPARTGEPVDLAYVSFDRIAVWTGDYSGSEFQLIDNRPSSDADEVAWKDYIGNFLEHHGVKGMKWGIRRANVGKGNERVVSTDAAKAKGAAAKKKKSGIDSLENHELQALVNRMNLEQSLKRLESSQPKGVAQKGSKVAAEILANVAKQQVSKLANDAVTKQFAKK